MFMEKENTSVESTTTQTTEATQATQKGEQKTFTQDDVNRIVQERLAKERSKASEKTSESEQELALNKREQELAQREFQLNNRQKLIERGYPETIMEALNCSSEEAFNKALDIIDSLIKEKTPTKEQTELEGNKARFTTASGRHSSTSEVDPIREAMKL